MSVHHNNSRADVSIPNETLSNIFEQLPAQMLARIARVSPRFNAVAERILYSSVSLTDNLAESSQMPRNTLRWCESMQRRPHLLDATKKLHIRWQGNPGSLPSHYIAPTCSNLSQILRQLSQLESLEIFLGPANLVPAHPDSLHPIEHTIYGCEFPLLRYCSLGAEWAKGVQPYTSILGSFLISLPSLRHLKLPDHRSALTIPPEALQYLSSFRGSTDTAALLLPGRPVQYLSLVGQDSDVNRENLPRLTHTSLPLRGLDLSAMSIRPILLRNFSTHLPTVEILKIRLALRHTLHYALSGIRLLAGLSAVLSAFHQLSFLDLSPTEVDGIGRADSTEEYTICKEWGRACPTLRRIIFPSRTEWMFSDDGDVRN